MEREWGRQRERPLLGAGGSLLVCELLQGGNQVINSNQNLRKTAANEKEKENSLEKRYLNNKE